jgi:L-threonylcarbamoyladenylate synthase
MNQEINHLDIDDIFAYPTEGVWGLGGCSLSLKAFNKLNDLKGRQENQPIILITSNFEHIQRWVDFDKLTDKQKTFYALKKSDFITFLLPAGPTAPSHCSFNGKIAFRLTNHPIVEKLSFYFQAPIFSTSANITGHENLLNPTQIKEIFPSINIINGLVGDKKKASAVYDLQKDLWIRK